jgi:hypothetical protein
MGLAERLLNGRTLNLNSNATWTVGNLNISNGSVINIAQGNTLDVQGDLLLNDQSSSSVEQLNVNGTLRRSLGGGIFEIEPRIVVNGAGANEGTIEVATGTLQLDSELQPNSGGTFTGAIIQGAGRIDFKGNAADTYDFDSSTSFTITQAEFSSGIATISGSTFAASTTVTNESLAVISSTTAINGPLLTTAGSTLRVLADAFFSSANLTVANGFTNNGLIELTSVNGPIDATLSVTNGTLTNAAGKTIASLVGGGGQRTLNAQVTNLGTIDVDQDLSISNSSRTFTTSAGTLDVASGKVLTINSGTTVFGAGTVFVGGGTIDLAGTHTLNLGSNFTLTNAAPLTLSGSVTVNGPGALINQRTNGWSYRRTT